VHEDAPILVERPAGMGIGHGAITLLLELVEFSRAKNPQVTPP
jgi:hypothetical protein